jgi:hypothetical protein
MKSVCTLPSCKKRKATIHSNGIHRIDIIALQHFAEDAHVRRASGAPSGL